MILSEIFSKVLRKSQSRHALITASCANINILKVCQLITVGCAVEMFQVSKSGHHGVAKICFSNFFLMQG